MSDLSILFEEREAEEGDDQDLPDHGMYATIPKDLRRKAMKQETATNKVKRDVAKKVGEWCKRQRPAQMHMTTYVHQVCTDLVDKLRGLRDEVDQQVVGTGIQTMFDKTYFWINNNSRYDADSEDPAPKRRRVERDAPKLPSANEIHQDNSAAGKERKARLLQISKLPADQWDCTEVRTLVQSTFALCTHEIRAEERSLVKMLLREWPLLVQPLGAIAHICAGFNNHDFSHALESFMAEEQHFLRYFLLARGGASTAKVDWAATQLKSRSQNSNWSIDLKTLILMLALNLGENIDSTFTTLNEEQFALLPPVGNKVARGAFTLSDKPCLVGRGDSLLNGQEFYLFVNKVRLSGPFNLFTGFKVLYAMHYIFEVSYQVKKTMQFLERVMMKNISGQPTDAKVTKLLTAYSQFKAEMS